MTTYLLPPVILTLSSCYQGNLVPDIRRLQAGNVSLEGSSPVEKEDIIDVTQNERRGKNIFFLKCTFIVLLDW